MTKSKEAAEKLKKKGFQCIVDTEKFWQFLNNEKIHFEEIKDVYPTNKLLF